MSPHDHRLLGGLLLVGAWPSNAVSAQQRSHPTRRPGRSGAGTGRPPGIILLLLLGAIHGPLWAQDSSAQRTSDENSQTSVWTEMGYVLAMETVFTGMSLLGSRQNGWGPAITGGADLLIAGAGLENASGKDPGVQKTGHYLISVGFAAKSLYNFRLGRDHSSNAQFWTNLIGYNVLVFVGYFLDTL